MNKRGFIKTLEAVIAIMIVFIFIFTMGQGDDKRTSNAEIMKSIQEGVLKGINQDEGFRKCIVETPRGALGISITTCTSSNGETIEDYVEKTLPERFTKGSGRYKIQICDPEIKDGSGKCTIPDLPNKYTYTSAVIISSTFKGTLDSSYKPRILRIWMW